MRLRVRWVSGHSSGREPLCYFLVNTRHRYDDPAFARLIGQPESQVLAA